MHFFLLGATGRVGKVVLEESLEHGHTVTALVRNTSSIEARPGLTLSKGSPMNADDVDAAFASAEKKIDAVLVTLAIKRESGSPWSKPTSPANLMETSVSNAVESMQKHGVRKLVVLSAYGVGDSFAELPWLLKRMIDTSSMGPQFQDHDNGHKAVKDNTNVVSVFVRPARLTQTLPKSEVKVHGNQGKGVGLMASINMASVADFMVNAAGSSTWNGQTPVITN